MIPGSFLAKKQDIPRDVSDKSANLFESVFTEGKIHA